jgi:putative mRNA 3-end processing factor
LTYPIDVVIDGAIELGPDVVCDGFLWSKTARVQTHVHMDHLADFETSKGTQSVLASKATWEMLCLDKDADLPYRRNFLAIEEREPYAVAESQVEVVSSGHMLGAVQVSVQLRDGMRVGYSGDFQWPLDHVIQVDALVVDATYGSPENVRQFSQGEVEERFLELVIQQLHFGPVHILAHKGTLQRGLQVLSSDVDCPMIGSARLCAEADLYRRFGYPIQELLQDDSQSAGEAMQSSRYIRFFGTGDRKPVEHAGLVIKLSGYFTKPDEPVIEYSHRAYGVALSNHADFLGTLEYVKATGAEFVVTDNTRGGKAIDLAQAINARLNIKSVPSSNRYSREWGR